LNEKIKKKDGQLYLLKGSISGQKQRYIYSDMEEEVWIMLT